MGFCLLAKLLMGHSLLAMLCINTFLIQLIIDTNSILLQLCNCLMGLCLLELFNRALSASHARSILPMYK